MQLSAWTNSLEGLKVGCFILDPPMGLRKNTTGWSMRDIMKTVNVIDQSFRNEYSIILYSMYSMASVQAALKLDPVADGSRLTVSRFILVKVKSHNFFLFCIQVCFVMTVPVNFNITSGQCCQLLNLTCL